MRDMTLENNGTTMQLLEGSHIKIVFVLTDLEGRGVPRVVLDLAKGFGMYPEVECHVVCLENHIEYEVPDSIRLHILDLPKKNILTAPFFRRLSARRIDAYILEHIGLPDLVLSNLTHVDKIMKFSQLPVMHVVHSTYPENDFGGVTDPARKKKLIESTYTRHPITCVSRKSMEGLVSNFSTVQPVTYIYNPVDVNSVVMKSESDAEAKFIQSFGDYIINVGAFVPAKNHGMLIHAWKMANVPHKLVLVGQGEEEAKMKSLVKELGVEDKVVFVGYHVNPFPFIKHAKLFVMSSLYEGLPCVMLETLAIGTPVVSTDCPGGLAELFGDSHRHCLSPVNDVEALAANIEAALADPQRYTVPLRDEFRLESVVSQYLKLVDQVRKNKLQ